MTLDELEKEYKKGLTEFYLTPPSKFDAIKVIKMHKWMDEVLVKYVTWLENNIGQQMKLGNKE